MIEHKEYLFAFVLGIMICLVLLINVNSADCPAVCDRLRDTNINSTTYNGGNPDYYECIIKCNERKESSAIL